LTDLESRFEDRVHVLQIELDKEMI